MSRSWGPSALCPPQPCGLFMGGGWGQGSESWSGGFLGSWDLRCLKLSASQKRGSAWVLRLQRKGLNILTGVETDRSWPMSRLCFRQV